MCAEFAGPPRDQAVAALSLERDADALRDVLLKSIFSNDRELVKAVLEKGLPVDTTDPRTGLSALHLAVGCDLLDMAQFLVGRGASFFSDKDGRWPTTIAAECEVSEALCDYIVEAEAAAIESRTNI